MRLAIALCALLALAPEALAEDVDYAMKILVMQLDDEEFFIRQHAAEALTHYPKEYAEKFLVMAQESDEEVAWSLRSIAKVIFWRTVVEEDDEYLRRAADEGCSGYWIHTGVFGWFVTGVYAGGASDGKLKPFDVIVEFDGRPPEWDGRQSPPDWARADREVELTVRRYADPDHAIAMMNAGSNNYLTFKVKIKPGWQPENSIWWSAAIKRANGLWQEFLERVAAEHPAPKPSRRFRPALLNGALQDGK